MGFDLDLRSQRAAVRYDRERVIEAARFKREMVDRYQDYLQSAMGHITHLDFSDALLTIQPQPDMPAPEPDHWGDSFDYYSSLAQNNYIDAQYNLGILYAKGLGTELNREQALRFFKLAAAQGQADACLQLGKLYALGENYESALFYLKKSAELGNPSAQFNLGIIYHEGLWDVDVDYNSAKQFYELAIDQGHVNAAFNLATLYHFGRIPDDSVQNAVHYYSLAAQADFSRALHNLGMLYHINDAGERNYPLALSFYRQALSSVSDDSDGHVILRVKIHGIYAVYANNDELCACTDEASDGYRFDHGLGAYQGNVVWLPSTYYALDSGLIELLLARCADSGSIHARYNYEIIMSEYELLGEMPNEFLDEMRADTRLTQEARSTYLYRLLDNHQRRVADGQASILAPDNVGYVCITLAKEEYGAVQPLGVELTVELCQEIIDKLNLIPEDSIFYAEAQYVLMEIYQHVRDPAKAGIALYEAYLHEHEFVHDDFLRIETDEEKHDFIHARCRLLCDQILTELQQLIESAAYNLIAFFSPNKINSSDKVILQSLKDNIEAIRDSSASVMDKLDAIKYQVDMSDPCDSEKAQLIMQKIKCSCDDLKTLINRVFPEQAPIPDQDCGACPSLSAA